MAGGRGRFYRQVGVAFAAGFLLMGGVALGYLAGAWLDRRLGTEPWLAVGGVVAGSVAGFRALVRQLLANGRDGG